MAKVQWIKTSKFEQTDHDPRIYTSGWINSKDVGIFNIFIIAALLEEKNERGNRKCDMYQTVAVNAEEQEEVFKEMQRACDYYEKHGKWPYTEEELKQKQIEVMKYYKCACEKKECKLCGGLINANK